MRDLFHNVDLWYFMNAELDRLEKNLKTNMDYKVKKRVRFEFNGNDWEISGLTKKNYNSCRDLKKWDLNT